MLLYAVYIEFGMIYLINVKFDGIMIGVLTCIEVSIGLHQGKRKG